MTDERKLIVDAVKIKKYFQTEVSISLEKPVVKAVDGVSLKIYENEVYGLVGESGCGKSTFGRTLLRLTNPTSGTISINGTDITGMKEKELRMKRKDMQMIFQDPYTSLNPRKKMGEILDEVLTIHGIKNAGERMNLTLEIMEKVGLRPEHYYRYPHEFSGGQRQRVGIARALILNPRFVVCDEPVSALDVSIQSQIINLLLDMKDEKKLTYLFIAHDLSVVKYISTKIGVMYLGHLVEEAPADELFAHPLHPYTQALLSAVPSTTVGRKKNRVALQGELPSPLHPPAGCPFHTRCPYAKSYCSEIKPKKIEVETGHMARCFLYGDTN
ncbi:MAG: dipeptide ABC transporter ATP-binding protein [Lachnospiraceae bacterium]|nr:dipeptide ABC transporter ATP-binding protein [Lachnospiraceae bacterium]